MDRKRGIFLLVVGLLFLGIVFASTFTDNTQANFNNGTYSSTEWNGSAVVLSSGQTSGNYISRIFDAGANATWNNLSKVQSLPTPEILFTVDNQADIWKSIDSGANWTLVKDDYNAGDGNGVTEIIYSKNKTLYIVYNQDIWISADSGVSWTKVNNNYNGAEGQNAFVVLFDKSDNFIIIEGDEDVWSSANYGVSWTKINGSDFNGGNGNLFGLAVNSSNVLFAVDGAADVWKSSNSGVSWNLVKDDYNGATGNNADGMAIDSNDVIYILDNQDVWKSIDSGATWTKINDDFNGAGDSNAGQSITSDSNNNIYIVDGSEDVFKSTDSGSIFTKVATDFNGANGQVPTMISVLKTTNLTYQVRNCSQTDCSDASFASVDLTNLNLTGRYFQYQVTYSSPDTSVTPQLNDVTIDYTLINTAPIINLVYPEDGTTYGYNTSLSLNFSVSDADNNLDFCWYNLNGGNNISIANCQNITFNISEGSHTLNIYANDSYGLSSNDSTSFSVQVGAPTITLSFPIGVYLNYQENVYFNYTATDVNLGSCELWGNFNGSWSLNQTNSSVVSGQKSSFILNLTDRTYLWNIKCNDTVGNSAFNGNKTFTVDTISPNLSLTQPTGTKNSRTGIPLMFNVSDSSPVNCWYNVYRGANVEVSNTSVDCNLSSTSFGVSVDADFILRFYVNDSAGNSASATSAFSVDTSGGTIVIGGGGGGGGSRSSSTNTNVSIFPVGKLGVNEISSISLDSGEKKKMNINVKNAGFGYLSDCQVKGSGVYASWIGSSSVKSLTAGETGEFTFDVSVPEDVVAGRYNVGLSIICKENSTSASFAVEVIKKQFKFNFIEAKRQEAGKVVIFYEIEELSGKDQSVNLQFLVTDLNNKNIAEVSETKIISSNSKQLFETIIPIDSSVEGALNLLVNLNSETYSSFSQEELVLSRSVSGFAIFSDNRTIDSLVSGALIVLFLVFAVFFIVRIVKLRNRAKVREKAFYRVK